MKAFRFWVVASGLSLGLLGCGDDEPAADTDAKVEDASSQDGSSTPDGSSGQDGSTTQDASNPGDDATVGGDATVSGDGAIADASSDGAVNDAIVDGGLLMCVGTASTCGSLTTSATCEAQDGCAGSGRCGDTRTCARNTSAKACSQAGCTWYRPCVRSSPACDTYNNKADCNADPQCMIDGGCVQDPAAAKCEQLTVQSECEGRATGCKWVADDFRCRGTAAACDTLDVVACASQDGCEIQ